MKLKRPEQFKVGDKGVKWFLVTCPDERPTSPKGNPRKGFEPGIYLEQIQARRRR